MQENYPSCCHYIGAGLATMNSYEETAERQWQREKKTS